MSNMDKGEGRMNFRIGQIVKPNTSKMKGQTGMIKSIGKNPALPYAVIFDGSDIEWDFNEDELTSIEKYGVIE